MGAVSPQAVVVGDRDEADIELERAFRLLRSRLHEIRQETSEDHAAGQELPHDDAEEQCPEETPEDAAVQEISDDDDVAELELERWREIRRGSRST